MNGLNSPCVFCHTNLDSKYRPALSRLEDIVIRFREGHRELWDDIRKDCGHEHLDWDIQMHCRYGLSCTKLKMQESSLRHTAESLNETLVYIAKTDKHLYHDVLELCRGYFPRVYSELAKIHQKGAKKNENETD